jgi:glutamate racemase
MNKSNKNNSSIGIFDSGYGGLEIMRAVVEEVPQYDYIYFGDNKRAPYGERSEDEILKFTLEAVENLFKQNCPLIIIACNTASSSALRRIQQVYLPKNYPDRRVLGVLIPAAEEAVYITKNKRVGVLATKATVQSQAFKRELLKLDQSLEVFQQAAPKLVPLVEQGRQETGEFYIALQEYLKPLLKEDIDTLILGCTHYGLVEKKVREIVGSGVKVVVEGKVVAKKLKNYLKKHKNIENNLIKTRKRMFLTTGDRNVFEKFGGVFFGRKITSYNIKLGCA